MDAAYAAGCVRVDLLRHGETAQRGFCGSVDAELTTRGWLQMQRTARHGGPWEAVVASPKRRCAAFAEAFAADLGLRCETEPRLAEYHFGRWEGVTAEQLWDEDRAALERFWQDPWKHPPPDAEPMEAFATRVEQGWAALLRRHAGRRVLLVTHAGVIRMLWHLCHRRPRDAFLRLQVAHASLHTLVVSTDPTGP